MKIVINNAAKITKRPIRWLRWKCYQHMAKFRDIDYLEVHIQAHGQQPTTYSAVAKLGVPGHDLIVKTKSEQATSLTKDLFDSILRAVRRNRK